MIALTVSLPVHLAIVEIEGIEVTEGPSAFEALEACAEAIRRRAAEAHAASPGAIAGVEHARALFRALAIDPTKRRPSSEALLKRALEGGPMPRVNTLVDAGNWCATCDSVVILYAPEPYDTRRLAGEAAQLASRIEAHCGGATARIEVVSGAPTGS